MKLHDRLPHRIARDQHRGLEWAELQRREYGWWDRLRDILGDILRDIYDIIYGMNLHLFHDAKFWTMFNSGYEDAWARDVARIAYMHQHDNSCSRADRLARAPTHWLMDGSSNSRAERWALLKHRRSYYVQRTFIRSGCWWKLHPHAYLRHADGGGLDPQPVRLP